jgi:uncharacterized protein YccT (UPF0319 family)
VSDNLIVSEVNNKSVDNGFISKQSSFELKQGNHALVLRYKDVFEDLEFAEDRLVKSQDFVVKFTITDQEQLKLSTIKIKNLAAAENFIKSPKLKLKDGQNNQLKVTLEKVSDYKLAKQVDRAVSALALNQTIPTKNSALTTSNVTTEKQANTSIQLNSLTMLKYWWQNASMDEKQRFVQFTKVN